METKKKAFRNAVQSFEGVLRSQHRVYDGSGEVARTQDVWGAEGISGRVKFLPLAWAGMPKTSFRKNSDSPRKHLKLQGLQPKTIDAYSRAIRRIGEHFQGHLDNLSQEQLVDYFGLTKRSQAAMALQGDFKLITTGTPIENHLGELWNLFHFINPGLLGSLKKFNERYAQAIENNKDHNTQQRLKKLLRPFILRRIKNDVLQELPAKTEITIHVELSQEERTFYEAMRRNAVQAMQTAQAEGQHAGQQHLKVLAEIMKLRRTCCHPKLVMEDSPLSSAKLQAFEELVDELISNRHKALVFSQFVGHLSIIRELLDKKGIHYQYLDGSTPVAKRKKAVNASQAREGDVFLISLKAGGSGLNLTAADYVIHMDPWWNPAVEDQASDRAHRMGQKCPVTIYRLVAKDTIEDKIVELHAHKRDLASSLLEGGEVSGKMSVNEMMKLIRETDD